VLVVHDEYLRRWQQHPHIMPQSFAIPQDRVYQHDADLAVRLEALFARRRLGSPGAEAELTEAWAQAKSYAP
jgi:hypothetical protein